VPQAPVPPAQTTAGNPYGSYVTPDSSAPTAGYGDYPPASGNGTGQGSYLPPASGDGNGSYLPATNGGGPAANGYWPGQAPGTYSGAAGPGYPNGSAPVSDPRDADPQAAGYQNGNGHGRHGRAPYPADNGYPAGPHDQAGYAAGDPYGREEYGGYPGYGAAER
jgi:hypothetical protein